MISRIVWLMAAVSAASCAHRPSSKREAERHALRQRTTPSPSDEMWLPADVAQAMDVSPVTASTAFDLAMLMEDSEPSEVGDVTVAPILAMTGTVTFDIPMSDDERVEQWIEYLTARGRNWYARWLSRSTRYVPIFWKILDEHELPRDLVFLSMIESGFSPRAYSWAHAAGAWQFMPATGRQYGLKVGFWIDERRDFELSTEAAARYLRRLHTYYEGDWYLAWAAYNGGVRRINRAIRSLGTRDFWRLSRSWHLRRETRHYVPKLLAAAKIAKQPEKYGFGDVVYLPQLKWEVMTVTVATDLATLAGACGVEDLGALNPSLRTGVTPPGTAFEARVPNVEVCEKGLAAIPTEERMTYRYYEVGRDSLEQIAEKFQTTTKAILEFNDIMEEQLFDFEELVVPIPLGLNERIEIRTPPRKKFRPNKYGPEGARLIVYEVRPGDSLWKIARRHRVSLKKLRLWNGLWKHNRLRVGQRLKLYVGRGKAPSHPRWKPNK